MKLFERLAAAAGAAMNVVGLGGERGSVIVSDTDPHPGEFKAIQVLEDAAFATETSGNMAGLPGSTILAGQTLHGLWDNVKLDSGVIVLYNS